MIIYSVDVLGCMCVCVCVCVTQTAMPGLRAFSTGNARERYQLLVDHLDALMLYHPGANAEAMEVRHVFLAVSSFYLV